jgi:ArsR family transcriptional regulator, arsenate/arsenite/antimonite-responsive transcriptional repressor
MHGRILLLRTPSGRLAILPGTDIPGAASMPTTAPPARRVDLLFRAFSDRTRLRILHVLLGRELCVGDLVSVLRVPQPSASRHLAYLRRAGLVVVRRDGLWCHYSLAPAAGAVHEHLLACLARCPPEVPELQADDARVRKVLKSGGCCPHPKETKNGR